MRRATSRSIINYPELFKRLDPLSEPKYSLLFIDRQPGATLVVFHQVGRMEIWDVPIREATHDDDFMDNLTPEDLLLVAIESAATPAPKIVEAT